MMALSGVRSSWLTLETHCDLFTRSGTTTSAKARGNASQFFIAGELCRRGYCAVVNARQHTANVRVLVAISLAEIRP